MKKVVVSTRLPPIEAQKVRREIKKGRFLNTSDFIRVAVREKLTRLKDQDNEDVKKSKEVAS